MAILKDLKKQLREALLEDPGLVCRKLKEVLPEASEKYDSIFIVEGRLRDLERQELEGTTTKELLQIGRNAIRADLMDFIRNLEAKDLASEPIPPKTDQTEPAEKEDQPKPTKTNLTILGVLIPLVFIVVVVINTLQKKDVQSTVPVCNSMINPSLLFEPEPVGAYLLLAVGSNLAFRYRADQRVDLKPLDLNPLKPSENYLPSFLWSVRKQDSTHQLVSTVTGHSANEGNAFNQVFPFDSLPEQQWYIERQEGSEELLFLKNDNGECLVRNQLESGGYPPILKACCASQDSQLWRLVYFPFPDSSYFIRSLGPNRVYLGKGRRQQFQLSEDGVACTFRLQQIDNGVPYFNIELPSGELLHSAYLPSDEQKKPAYSLLAERVPGNRRPFLWSIHPEKNGLRIRNGYTDYELAVESDGKELKKGQRIMVNRNESGTTVQLWQLERAK